ncbi:hypothetical protein T07_3768 [Trichinella nelsoni]|uniref:Uncharacterized protein n=1 Tax=Trichinella nelsoni TaxID=6336 RepID=A0A0V0RM77_9BILA|nr:hypothetical protein T07_3768 [Trichinella nelsoni]
MFELNTADFGACFKSNMQEAFSKYRSEKYFYKLEAFSVQQMNMFLKINVLSNLFKCAFPFSAPDFGLTEFPVVNCADKCTTWFNCIILAMSTEFTVRII